jgi:hypothetical protein
MPPKKSIKYSNAGKHSGLLKTLGAEATHLYSQALEVSPFFVYTAFAGLFMHERQIGLP